MIGIPLLKAGYRNSSFRSSMFYGKSLFGETLFAIAVARLLSVVEATEHSITS